MEHSVASLDIALQNLISPMTLCFVLGVVAVAVRSDLALPEPVARFLSLYLMLAIGLKGGAELAQAPMAAALPAFAAGLLLTLAIPFWVYLALRRLTGRTAADCAAFAAHYGSVSAVTFIAATAFLDSAGIAYGSHATALLALMEAPAIVVAIMLARHAEGGAASASGVLGRTLSSKSVVLLAGGLAIGAIVGPAGLQPVKPLFVDLFRGLLCLFMLDLGLQAARQGAAIRQAAPMILVLGVAVPLVNAALGLALASVIGLSVGEATILATLAASASYIVAPAAIRSALPEADAGLALTAALAVTFPFNLLVGLPLYLGAARLLVG